MRYAQKGNTMASSIVTIEKAREGFRKTSERNPVEARCIACAAVALHITGHSDADIEMQFAAALRAARRALRPDTDPFRFMPLFVQEWDEGSVTYAEWLTLRDVAGDVIDSLGNACTTCEA